MSKLSILLFLLFTLSATNFLDITNAQKCKISGSQWGKKVTRKQCNPHTASCCRPNRHYKTYKCSPSITGSHTKAVLTLNSFEEGGDGGGESACDRSYHSDNTKVVALSTGWFKGGSRCGKEIVIHGNGRSTKAKVVDECDSTMGCDKDHGYQLPCRNFVVDVSEAVWEALGVGPNTRAYDRGQIRITWSMA